MYGEQKRKVQYCYRNIGKKNKENQKLLFVLDYKVHIINELIRNNFITVAENIIGAPKMRNIFCYCNKELLFLILR